MWALFLVRFHHNRPTKYSLAPERLGECRIAKLFGCADIIFLSQFRYFPTKLYGFEWSVCGAGGAYTRSSSFTKLVGWWISVKAREARAARSVRLVCAILALWCFIGAAPRLSAAEPTVDVTAFIFRGNTVFSGDELGGVVADAVGPALTLADLEAAADRVTAFYRGNGYLAARAFVPEQRVEAGRVEIAVMEGHYDGWTVANTSNLDERVAARYLQFAAPGALVEEAPLRRGVLLLSDLPGVAVRANLLRGGEPGTTTLAVEIASAERFSGHVEIDNFGNVNTGRIRLGTTARLDNATGRGDRVRLHLLTAGRNLWQAQIGYEFPVGVGSTLTASHSWVSYALDGDFAALNASGRNGITSLSYRWMNERSLVRNSAWTLGYSQNVATDSLAGNASVRRVQDLSGGYWREWRRPNGGTASFTATLHRGRLALDDAAAAQADAMTARAAGDFVKVEASYTQSVPLGGGGRLDATLRAQWGSKNLDPGEKFRLGGPTGVRALPSGGAAGDDGWLASVEWHRSLAWASRMSDADAGVSHRGGLEAILFVDIGWVRSYKFPWDAQSEGSVLRQSAGIGVDWQNGRGSGWRIDAAVPLGPWDDGARAVQIWSRFSRRF